MSSVSWILELSELNIDIYTHVKCKTAEVPCPAHIRISFQVMAANGHRHGLFTALHTRRQAWHFFKDPPLSSFYNEYGRLYNKLFILFTMSSEYTSGFAFGKSHDKVMARAMRQSWQEP